VLPVGPVGEPDEIELFQIFKISSSGLVRDAFVLHRALITVHSAANDEGTVGVPTQIDDFPSRLDRVEDDLERVRDDEADDSSLSGTERRGGGLNGEGVDAHEREDVGARHRVAILIRVAAYYNEPHTQTRPDASISGAWRGSAIEVL
jgi:hypothetical protein